MTNDLALEMPPRSAGTRAGDEWPSHKHRARRRRQRRRHTERTHR